MSRLLLIALLLPVFGFSQTDYVPVNRDSIEKWVSEENSYSYYPRLLERFERLDTTLTRHEYRLLYYGFVFQDSYVGYPALQQDRVNSAYQSGRFDLIEQIADSILEKYPVNLFANLHKGLAIMYKDSTNSIYKRYFERYAGLLDAIVSSGDGRTCETAFRTICVNDEYIVIYRYFEIEEFKGQSLAIPCDRMHVSPSNYYPYEYMYFNTSETLEYMNRMFRTPEKKKDKKKKKSKKE